MEQRRRGRLAALRGRRRARRLCHGGRPLQICELLRGIIGQGWTSIKIKIVNVRPIGGVILIASEYATIGSGENAGKTLNAASSYVLVESNGDWLSTLHTAR
jgi:hypothetical protein